MAGPTYVYYSTVPQGATNFNLTQPQILSNFQAIYELVGVNHVNFNVPNNYGKHNYCILPSQTTAPTVTTTDGAVYCSTSTEDPGYKLYYEYPDGTITDIANQVSELYPQDNTSNTIKFASGFQMSWGQIPGKANPIAFTDYAIKVTYTKAPFVAVSEISGAYYPFTRHGAYNITQTNYYANVSVNYIWAALSFGF